MATTFPNCEIPAAAAAADATANPTSTLLGSLAMLFNGTTWDRQRAAAGTTGIAAVNTEGTKTTYRASAIQIGFTAAGVMLVLQGSATKTIRVTKVLFSGHLTTADRADVGVYRTTADVSAPSGTATITIIKNDTTNAAATAVAKSYTTSSIGAGTAFEIRKVMIGSATVAPTTAEFKFGDVNGQGMVLRGVAEFMQLFVTAGAGTYTGASFDATVEWTEE